MRLRIVLEVDVEEGTMVPAASLRDGLSPGQVIGQQVRYTLADGLVNFVQVRTDHGRKTVRQVVEQETRRKHWLDDESRKHWLDDESPGYRAKVDAKAGEREARCLLAEGLRRACLLAEVRILAAEDRCPDCDAPMPDDGICGHVGE